ncbi:hypothetical protein Q0601_04105 [Paracoccus onubensis]|uniref:hypothetical protein n=1 Tax=Paracoccus onubensis TaxID=1675788 RepID=UPI00272F01E2|nr:hypothetical protein [Paracoccus onubensis]MDP0926351.1 hypothetical protein [Paracoccus onubensis]
MNRHPLSELELGARPEGRSLLTADWVLAHDGTQPVMLKRGEVVIEHDRVIFAGHGFQGEVARRIDFGAALISPGLIDLDALSDLDTTLLGIDHFPSWKKGRVWPISYVERGPYEMYSPRNLPFRNASPLASFC